MFPRRERLSRELFPAIMRSGRRLSSPHFSAIYSTEARGYAVVVSKKVARLSVTRHRIKRRVFAALQALSLPSTLIIFPKSSASSVSYQDTKAEIEQLLADITKRYNS